MAATVIVAVSPAAAAQPQSAISGRVVGVTDGDTLKVLTPEHRLVRVRLVELDAPEHDQPWGQRAKQDLSSLVFGRTVRVVTRGQDRYGRTLGRVYADGLDVNAELVRRGDAWAYREYLTDPRFLAWEAAAHAGHRGLWSISPAVAPWSWRKAERGDPASPRRFISPALARPFSVGPAASRVTSGLNCSAKRYCREMKSCAEARAFLSQCGLRRLDGDGDGVPCEAICR